MSGVSRTDALRLIDLGDAIAVSALGYASWCLGTVSDRPTNFYLRGAMGSAVPVGFGLARARPERKVIVFEGEGSVLMNLGALTTVAAYPQANLTIVVWDDRRYQTTGGQVTHTARGADLAAIARGAGIQSVASPATGEAFRDAYRKAMAGPGPHVIVVSVVPETTPPLRRSSAPPVNLHSVMASLGTCDCHPGEAGRPAR